MIKRSLSRPVLDLWRLALPLALGLATVPSFAQTGRQERPDYATGPGVLAKVKYEQKPGAQLPLDLEFRDEDGKPVRLRDLLADRPIILNLVYYECPMLCDQVLSGLVRNLNVLEDFRVGRAFDIWSVSISPEETPDLARAKEASVLRAYHFMDARAQKGWHFLTTENKESIDALASSVGFSYTYNPNIERYAHPAGVVIVTPEGKVSRYIYGISFPARDLKLALTEASNGEIGGVIEQALLLCYAYDPDSGTYSFAIMRVIQGLGILTVLGLGGYVGLMLLVDRKRPAPASGLSSKVPGPTSH